ncbi:hypothetical protein [Marinobacter sp. F4206]|uniref:hypothetical protein n=1 Tax=Marinobacter sp. F4206 TaxID=2861777 RepID=UPI001C5F4F88|nr:hypothetical protein [Marinobacter sp. F4206]MBW4934982.1 hypothetical protein [Marinobacter sp. F4206]
MKRLLIVLVVAVAGLSGFAYYKITSSVTDGLELAKMQVAPFAAMEYGSVSTNFSGDITVNDLRFTSRATSEVIAVDKVALGTGSPWALLTLKDHLQSGQMPDYLKFSLEGLKADMAFMSNLEQAAEGDNPFSQLETAGCGDRRYFNRSDLARMGYDYLTLDMDVAYRLSETGNQLTLTIDTVSRNQMAVGLEMVVYHSGSFNEMALSPQVAKTAQLEAASIELEDLGYLNRILDFCANELEMDTEAYRARHLEAWTAEWQAMGLKPSDSLVEVYQDYLTHPGSTLTFQMEPFPALDLGDNYLSPDPVYLSGRLNPKLGTERSGLQSISVSQADTAVAEERSSPSSTSESAPSKPAAPEPTRSAPARSEGRISLAQLDDHLQHDVQIQLADGRAIKGRIQAVEGNALKLKRHMYGGTLVVPVPLGDIRSVTLL